MSQRSDYGNRTHAFSGYSGNGVKRAANGEKERKFIGAEDTVYRYLCSLRKIGAIIGIGGDIANKLRAQTHAIIQMSEIIPGCEERVVTIYSTSDETNSYGGSCISPAQDALFRIYDKLVAAEVPVNGEVKEPVQVSVRLLVPSDQIGCVIGKGGKTIQGIRNETRAQVRILDSGYLPPCALGSEELIQITGDANVVKQALSQVAFCLHESPSRSQQSLMSSLNIYKSGIAFNNPKFGDGSLLGASSLMGPYGNYRNNVMKEFKLDLVCPAENLGSVIGKGGATIKQIRHEFGACINIDTAGAVGEECVITVSAKEMFEGSSRVIDAVMRLQARCSITIYREFCKPDIITRLLVISSRIGCIVGKSGSIIKDIRNKTTAIIRITWPCDENVPQVASGDYAMVQEVHQHFQMGYLYASRNETLNPGNPNYSASYNYQRLPPADNYRCYDNPKITGRSGYRAETVYSSSQFAGPGTSRYDT